jgi:putative ABC transport system permease protein
MLVGRFEDLRQPDAVIIDRAGYEYFYPHQPLRTGGVMEMNDHRAVIVGICEASAPFATFPVVYTRYSQAINYVGRERDQLSLILAKPVGFGSATNVCNQIEKATGLKARTTNQFTWQTIQYYLRNTGIPVNFGITIAVALIVGTVVAGQTFYIFTLENLKQFGVLKAIGVTNRRLVGMILLQALVVAAIGYALGMGLAAEFFNITIHRTATRGFVMLWPIMAGAGAIIFSVVVVASLLSVRKVLVLESAIVFRG